MSKQKLSPLYEHPNYYVDPISNIIYHRKSYGGRELKFSCHTDNITIARRYAAKEVRKKLGFNKKSRIPLLDFWMEKYIEERCEQDLSDSAIRCSVNAINQSIEFWRDFRVDEITKDNFSFYYKWYRSKYDFQFDNAFKYFRNFTRWLSEEVYYGRSLDFKPPMLRNPEAKANRIKRKRKKERTISTEEFAKIYSVCDQREKLLVSLMYTMAFRVESDALSSRWEQFRLNVQPPLYIFGEADNKAGLEGKQAIHDFVLKQLLEWRKERGDSIYVFPQAQDQAKHMRSQMINWDALRKKANLGWHWTAHTFRHSCLTELVEKGQPLNLISKCYRISIKELLDTYAHLTPEGLLLMQNAIEIKL